MVCLLGLLVVGLIVILANSNWKLYRKRVAIDEEVSILQDEFIKLKERTEELEVDIAKIQTQEYLERTARERLNLKKPGEEVVAVVIPGSGQEERRSAEQKQSWWEKILEKMIKLLNG